MTLEKFEILGPALLTPKTFSDERGFFTERFRLDEWKKAFPDHAGFIQDNFSQSKAGVLRGLHFQFNPNQGKLVTCVAGAIVDVIVDIRLDSKTLGQHLKIELSADLPRWLWVPPGFAHGFVVTSPGGAGVLYKVDQLYHPANESAICWNDPELKIEWPHASPILSAKDASAKSFGAYRESALARSFRDVRAPG